MCGHTIHKEDTSLLPSPPLPLLPSPGPYLRQLLQTDDSIMILIQDGQDAMNLGLLRCALQRSQRLAEV